MTPLEITTPGPSEKCEMGWRGGDKLHNYGNWVWKQLWPKMKKKKYCWEKGGKLDLMK